jgi:hypothetical protein
MKLAANTDEQLKRASEHSKHYWSDDANRKRMSDRMEELWQDTDFKNAMIERIRNTANDPAWIAKMKEVNSEIWNRPDVKQKLKEAQAAYWSDENNRKECSDKFLKLWSNDEYKERMIQTQIIAQNTEGSKEKRRVSMIARWSDPEFAKQQFKSRGKYKEFILPSGNVVKIQGYEPQVLTELLKTYDESDIFIEVKNINATIGKISYVHEGKLRTYYPDFYIKSINTIIEVKSKYTFGLHIEKNLAKEQACLQQGFNFDFIIL